MNLRRRVRPLVTAAAVAATSLLGVTVPSAGATASTSVVTYAEAPGSPPNYIFPFASCLYDTSNNIQQFQQLMYRPLYWFGVGSSMAESPALSLADAPVFNKTDTEVTITMKGWRFANGNVVGARSVLFFLNLYKSDPVAFCGYEAGFGIPDQVRTVSAVGDVVHVFFTKAVNPTWITDNFLSQITPLDPTWDRTSASSAGRCSTGAYGTASTEASCKAVETYLDTLATATKSFTQSFWQGGDDGPWRLVSLDASGDAAFRANADYSGPQRPEVPVLKEVAFSSEAAELAALESDALDVGYVDPTTLATRTSSGATGPNLAALGTNYNLEVGSPWGFDETIFNFNAQNAKSAIIAQLYVREALQEAIDQASMVTNIFKGYGYVADSPLPPATPAAIAKPVTNPYPFSLSGAKDLLTSHGWTLSDGVMTCTSPGVGENQCGANISAGTTLSLSLVWPSDDSQLNALYSDEISDWAQIGVVVTPNYDTSNNVADDCGATSAYQLCGLPAGWEYVGCFFPSGEELFTPGGAANFGDYDNAHLSALVAQTLDTATNLSAYAQYAATELPVLYQPQAAQVIEVSKSLKSALGFTPNPGQTILPEYDHY